MSSSSPRLKVIQMEVTGYKGCKVPFEDGLNIIRGENSLGKTTVLKLIHYGLGAGGDDFIKEINECENLLLDVSLNGQHFRIRRHLQKRSARVRVYPIGEFGLDPNYYFDYQLGREFSDFLLHNLNMPINQIPRGGRLVGETRPVSFLELFRLMYVSQDWGYVSIQARQRYERMKHAVFETLLALSGMELFDLEVERSNLEARKQEIQTEIANTRRLLQELNVPTKGEINQRIDELQTAREAKVKELQTVKQRLRGTPQWALAFRQEIVDLDQEVQATTEEIAFLNQKLNEYRLSRNDALNEQQRLQRFDISRKVLSSFTFLQCPRCSQSITNDMRAREDQRNCMLCGRPLLREQVPQFDVVKQIGDLKDEVSELDQLIQRYGTSVKAVGEKRDRLLQEKESKEQELDERMGEHYTTAFVADLEIISGQIGASTEKVNQWRSFLAIWSKLDERYTALKEVEAHIEEVDSRLNKLRQKKANDLQKLSVLGDHFHGFLHDVFRDYQFSKIDEDSYEPLINNHRYDGFSAVQKDTAILAYHYALLRYSLDHDSNYPRFLIIDTPNKDDLDPDLYAQLMHKFTALKQETEPYQLIIATRDVPKDLQDDVVLSFEQDYLLRDIQLRMF